MEHKNTPKHSLTVCSGMGRKELRTQLAVHWDRKTLIPTVLTPLEVCREPFAVTSTCTRRGEAMSLSAFLTCPSSLLTVPTSSLLSGSFYCHFGVRDPHGPCSAQSAGSRGSRHPHFCNAAPPNSHFLSENSTPSLRAVSFYYYI